MEAIYRDITYNYAGTEKRNITGIMLKDGNRRREFIPTKKSKVMSGYHEISMKELLAFDMGLEEESINKALEVIEKGIPDRDRNIDYEDDDNFLIIRDILEFTDSGVDYDYTLNARNSSEYNIDTALESIVEEYKENDGRFNNMDWQDYADIYLEWTSFIYDDYIVFIFF